jgi:phosphatidylinositol 4-kinase
VNIFDTLIWFQEDRITETGNEANVRESTLFSHACFLIKSMSQREEHIRDISVNLLTQLRDKFPQVVLFGNAVCSR